jgi:hypothetical protein
MRSSNGTFRSHVRIIASDLRVDRAYAKISRVLQKAESGWINSYPQSVDN